MFLPCKLHALSRTPAAYSASADTGLIVAGVTFTHVDGRSGMARTHNGGGVIDQAVKQGTAWPDRRWAELGIREESWGLTAMKATR